MRRKLAWCSLFCLTLIFCPELSAQTRPRTPGRDDPERRAVLDALRAPVQKQLKRKVIFKVDELRLQEGWAFLRGVPRRPDGSPMDYRGTIYQELIDDGLFDDWICALLRKQGGEWRVVTYIIGATDVPFVEWAEKYKAPPALFGTD